MIFGPGASGRVLVDHSVDVDAGDGQPPVKRGMAAVCAGCRVEIRQLAHAKYTLCACLACNNCSPCFMEALKSEVW